MKHPRSVGLLEDIFGLRFLVRASLDVPIHDGVAEDHFRIHRAMPTFLHLLERGARVIILTHVGRDPKNSTRALLPILSEYFSIHHCDEVVGERAEGMSVNMKEGTALLLENLRSHEGEEANDEEFARTLASYADFYVNDAFAVSHRAHASIVGIPKYLPSFAGFTFMEEYEALMRAFTPESPSLFILGGAKFETKAPLIKAYADTYTNTFIGGALANDFLKGKGYEVGTSLLSDVDLTSNPLLEQSNILLPSDVRVDLKESSRIVDVTQVTSEESILDIGPKSVETLAPYIKEAKTILWNGPTGYYEKYDESTKAIARLVAESDAFSIVGGGDTVSAIESLDLAESFGFLSTAGGAMLEFLEKRTLPGIEAIAKD